MLIALVTFAVAATLIILLPGPDTLVTVRSILRAGARPAWLARAHRGVRLPDLAGGAVAALDAATRAGGGRSGSRAGCWAPASLPVW